jgi:hypothetical protein
MNWSSHSTSYPDNYAGFKIANGFQLYGDDGTATQRLIGIDSSYRPPWVPRVAVGSDNSPTYYYGKEHYFVASSGTYGPGKFTIDCDGGTNFSVLNDFAWEVTDRNSPTPNRYARFRVFLDLTNFPDEKLGLNLFNGAGIYNANSLSVSGPSTLLGSYYSNKTVVSSATYTITASDSFVYLDATSAGITVQLPAAVGNGRVLNLKKVDTSGNVVVFKAASGETIDGSAAVTTSTPYAAIGLQDGASTKWWVH